jgi:hypothetical protein
MPSSPDNKSGQAPGRAALLQRLAGGDVEGTLRDLLQSAVLKDDLNMQDMGGNNATPGAQSLPNNREVFFTRDGGLAVRMLATEDLERGDVVTATSSQDYVSCRKYRITTEGYRGNDPPTGVVMENVASGGWAIVTVAGMARVKVEESNA